MSDIPPGFCQCGCGQKTKIARFNAKAKGWQAGVPLKFIRGHNMTLLGLAQTKRAIGRKSTSSHGYIRVRCADGTRQYEHIIVAESAVGRKLKNFGQGHPETEVVHHVDGDKKNNNRSNLLICTHRYHVELHARLEQSPNWPQFAPRHHHPRGCARVGRVGFKGVSFNTSTGLFSALLTIKRKRHTIGHFAHAEQAAIAYDEAAIAHHGANWITNRSMGLLP